MDAPTVLKRQRRDSWQQELKRTLGDRWTEDVTGCLYNTNSTLRFAFQSVQTSLEDVVGNKNPVLWLLDGTHDVELITHSRSIPAVYWLLFRKTFPVLKDCTAVLVCMDDDRVFSFDPATIWFNTVPVDAPMTFQTMLERLKQCDGSPFV